jgi:glyoxylase-like metal-dependent hydrolase (beta-lactamase superfamily II)
LNLDAPGQSAEIGEKVIRKLRGGLMPPAGVKRPDGRAVAEFVSWLENAIDTATVDSEPGRVALRRLNRREYGYAIRDLLGLNIDASAWLPQDNVKGNFDNNAAALQVSPNFIDQYIHAARAVALEAIGNPKAPAETVTYGDVENMVISLPPQGAPGTGRQQHRLEGMPFGTRGGFSVEHNFPADGDYELTIGDMALAREVPRMAFENTVIALLDGVEFYRTTIGGEKDHKAIDQRPDPAVEEINSRLRKIRFTATQGQHKLAITFVHRSFAESDERTRTIALEGGQERIQAAHALQIRGPLSVTGLSRSPSRSKIFICRPASAREEMPCALKIVENLARRAFRRPVGAEDVNPLMAFYKSGSATGGFEGGVRDALGAILASPHFLYRAESGEGAGGIRTLSDLELASRLSFFLWSSLPDEELLKLASASRLNRPDVLAGQVTRMLADPRAKSLSDDFAFQWLQLSKLDEITPDRAQFPHASGPLDPRALLKEELRLFVDSVLRSDRSVMELLTADYTFLNERLAMLYGIETVKGANFRRVTLEQTARHGLLGKGAILMLTAYPNRTSPVVRGAIRTTDLGGAVLLQGGGGNVLAVPGPDGALLIDGGSRGSTAALMAALRTAVRSDRVRMLINTHWHPDQTGANEAVGKAGGVIIAHEKTKLLLGNTVYSAIGFSSRVPPLAKEGQPAKTVRGDGSMEFASQQIDYGYMPAAHTDGDLYVHLPKLNLLVVGGVVSAEEWPLLDYKNGAWLGGRVRAVERLAAIVRPDTRVVPATGRMMTGKEILRHRDVYQKLFTTMIGYLNMGQGPEDAVARNPLKEYEKEFGDASDFEYAALRSMMIAYVPD